MRKNGFDITHCEDCGVGRTQVDHFDPVAHYSEGYFTGEVEGAYLDYEGSEATLRREFREQLQFLIKLLPGGGKLLEIGCAYGFFLQALALLTDIVYCWLRAESQTSNVA